MLLDSKKVLKEGIFERTFEDRVDIIKCNITTMLSVRLSKKVTIASFRRMKMSSFSTLQKDDDCYRLGLTGGSGLLGTAILDELSKHAYIDEKPVKVIQFVRSSSSSTKEEKTNNNDSLVPPVQEVLWNPKNRENVWIDDSTKEIVNSLDGMIHLAGENIGTSSFLPSPLNKLGIHAWTDSKKKEILASRIGPTQAIAENMSSTSTLLTASGISIYGQDFIGPNVNMADESSPVSTADDFLVQVSHEWEAASTGGKSERVVNLRIAPVLSKYGGALEKLYPIFFMGGGGRVGNGQQWFSYISSRDAARAILYTLSNPAMKGPVNLCAPTPCTNHEFTTALGTALSRPTFVPLPAFIVQLMFGQMGQEILLGGVKASPQILLQNGFEFQHSTIDQAIHSALTETI